MYEVRNSELRSVAKPSKGKHPFSLTLDSDSSGDAFMQYSKKGKFVSNKQSSELITEIQGLRKMIEQLFEVNKQLPIPIGLRKILHETFCCCNCRCTMVPPVRFGRCCKSLIGCQSCVDRWFQGDSRLMQQSCPKCRTEHAYLKALMTYWPQSTHWCSQMYQFLLLQLRRTTEPVRLN